MTQPSHNNDNARRAAEGVLLQHPHANRSVNLQDPQTGKAYKITYFYELAKRRSIGLSIDAQGLRIRAPRWVSQACIDECLHAKAGWILQKLRSKQILAEAKQPSIQWRDATVLDYQGQNLRLALGFAGRTPLLQRLPEEGAVVLHLPLPLNAEPARIARLTQEWFRIQALQVLHERVSWYAPQMGVQPSKLMLTSARTRWGSASSNGVIRLHWRLIQMRTEILDYVVVHELAHLHEMNHSPRFWSWVERFMPDYQRWQQQLKAVRLPEWDV